MTENEFTYWAFLSYSQQDNCEKRPNAQDERSRCWGDWLHGELKSFSIPAEFVSEINARGEIIPERIDPIFQDREEKPETAELSEGVRRALEQSKCLIVLCSPRSAKSLYVNEAVRYFKQLGRGNRILPLVIAGAPNASDGNQPGISPDDECFVPALRHPLKPDGTLDITRRDREPIFADARHGADKREILATDHQPAQTELEIARIQLIAGLIGVGFNGLWGREQKRRFAAVPIQARETRQQIQEAQNPDPEVQNKLLEALHQAREAQQQIQELRQQAHEAQSKVLEAQSQAQEALSQVAEARNQAQVSESKFLEAQRLAQEAQSQLEAARNQVREAQNQVLEIQNLPQDVKSQLQDAQNKVQEAQEQARNAQSQAEAARNEVRDAQSKFAEAQQQVLAAQSQVQEIETQARQTQNQLAEARNQAQAAESKLLEAQQQAQTAQQQIEEAYNQARDAQNKIQEIQNQTRDAQSQIQAAQSEALEAQNQARAAQTQVKEIQNKSQAARRLTKVFAVMAVLALMAAGLATNSALRQRKLASQALAKPASAEIREADLAAGAMNRAQIRQALQKASGAGLNENRQRRLDELAAGIPTEEIPEALKSSAVILDDRQRSDFQKQLLIRLSAVNPQSAMTNASGIEGEIVNNDGASDSSLYFQLAALDNWIKTDLPTAFDWSCQLADADSRQRALEKIIPALPADNLTNTLAKLNELKPAPDEHIYTLLFERWAAKDPVQAIEQRQQIPGQDADGQILSAIMTAWADQQPEAALKWLQSQPDSESLPAGTWRNIMVADLFDNWAAKNVEAATTACQQLPDGAAKAEAWECVLNRWIEKDPASAAEPVKNLPAGNYRQNAIEALCNHWSETDATAALAWAQSLSSAAEQTVAISGIVANWAHKDPQAATQFASQHSELSSEVLGEIAEAWSQSDLTAAASCAESLPDGEKKDAALLAVASSAEEIDPKLAAKSCTLLTTSQPKTELIQSIADSLAEEDVSSAVEWARNLKDDATRHTALSALSETWAQNDPKDMAAYALSLPAGDDQTQYLTAACRQLAVRDLATTVELLQPLSDAALRQSILEQAARNCDLSHLNPTAKYIATMPAGDDQKAVIKGLVLGWSSADPETAVNWLRSFPETNSQPDQVQSVVKIWAQSEPAAVAKWLANFPAGTTNDAIVGVFLEGAVVKYPEFAAQWTQSVTNETERQKYQIQIARLWLKTDPSAATKWIDGLNFSEEIRQSLKTQSP